MSERDRGACLRQILLALEVQLLRIVDRDRTEPQTIAWLELRDQRKIDARHFADPWIAARRLPVGHQNDRHSVRRKLHCAERDAFRQELDGITKRKLDAF